MKLETGSVTKWEFGLSIFCFMNGTMLRTGYIISITKNDSWAMAYSGLILALFIVAIYSALMRMYPGKSLIEINDAVFGPVLGRIITSLYLFYFLTLSALNTRDLGNFVEGSMIPATPIAAIMILHLLVCAYVLRKGVANILKLSVIISIANIFVFLLNFTGILKDAEISFIKPFFHQPVAKYIQGTVSIAAVPMGEVIAFMMLIPMLKDSKNAGKTMALGLTAYAVFSSLIIMRDIITLGPLSEIIALPSIESVKYIKVAEVITRLESIYAVMILVLFLFKVSIMFFASLFCLTGMLKLASIKPYILVTSALLTLYSLFVFESVRDNVEWGASAAPFWTLTFQFVLPFITLLSGIMKKLNREKEADI